MGSRKSVACVAESSQPAVGHSFVTSEEREALALAGYSSRFPPGISPALLVVDVTPAFCGDQGQSLIEAVARYRTACGPAAWSAVPAICRLIGAARERGVPVVYTQPDASLRRSMPGLWGAKNVRVAQDAAGDERILEAVSPAPADVVLRKLAPSAFFQTPLTTLLRQWKTDSLIVCGGTTSGCVRATVVDAFSHGIPVVVAEDGTFDRVGASHEIALFDMALKYAEVQRVEHIARVLRAGQARAPTASRHEPSARVEL